MRPWQPLARRLLLLSLLLPVPTLAGPYTGVYLLGDSLSDQGNLYEATSVLGPQSGQPVQPASDHYFEGRFSNGEVYSGLLAQQLGLSLDSSLRGGTNFAFGGTRTDYNRIEAPPSGEGAFARGAAPWTLNLQRQAFTDYIAAHGPDPGALYVVFSGSNDVADILSRGKDPASIIAGTVAGIVGVVDAFRDAGARTVLVPNLPDLGVAPFVARYGPGISRSATDLVQRFNTALDAALVQETGIDVVRFDTFGLFRDVVADPSSYGFTNATQACYSGFVLPDPTATECANPGQYVFWDVEHPTTAFHALLAERMALAVTQVPEPGVLAILVPGLAVLCLARCRAARPV